MACVIEGWSLVEIIQKNVTKMNTGIKVEYHIANFQDPNRRQENMNVV